MSASKHWLLGGWYYRGELIVDQEGNQRSDVDIYSNVKLSFANTIDIKRDAADLHVDKLLQNILFYSTICVGYGSNTDIKFR